MVALSEVAVDIVASGDEARFCRCASAAWLATGQRASATHYFCWRPSSNLDPKALQRFRVRRRDGQYRAPSLSAIRSLLIRVNPAQLDAALRTWHEAHGGGDSALAIDGKTIRGAIDADGNQTHVLGIVGHGSKAFWGKKKSA